MPDFNNYVYFVLQRNSNASYSFTGYTHPETGQVIAIYKGRRDKDGREVPHRFKFDKAHRSMRIHKNEKDSNGNSVVEFLRDFPECANSPNGSYAGEGKKKVQTNIWFYELNEGKDAKEAVDAKRAKIEAESLALRLEGEELRGMAILCGTFDDDETKQLHRVLEYAGADPERFMTFYKSPDREATILLRRAVKAGLIRQKAQLFIWEDVTVGTSEGAAIAKLMEDEVLKSAIEDNLKALGA